MLSDYVFDNEACSLCGHGYGYHRKRRYIREGMAGKEDNCGYWTGKHFCPDDGDTSRAKYFCGCTYHVDCITEEEKC